jgi:hypothetical protein
MKAVRNLTAAALLAFALTLSVSAGEIHTGGYTPPPPAQPTEPDTPDGTGDDGTGETGDTGGDLTDDLLTAILNGLLIIL